MPIFPKGGTIISKEENVQETNQVYVSAFDFKKSQITQNSRYHNQENKAAKNLSGLKSIIQNPQDWNNFYQLLQHVGYYSMSDSMCAGAIRNIMVPFSQAPYRLVGSNKKTRQIYQKILDKNNFEDILHGLAMDYWIYGQAYFYLERDYTFQLLPPFRCQVESLSIGGEPIVSYEIERTSNNRSQTDIEKLLRKYKGHPDVVEKAIKKGSNFAQLEQDKLFRVAYTKSAWEKYSIPMLTAALPWLVQKDNLIDTQITELENIQRTFLEVKVGDEKITPRPNEAEFALAASAYIGAIQSQGASPAAVSWNVKSEWKQIDSRDALKGFTDTISFVNYNILSALSISPQLASGDSPPNKNGSSNFSATQASVSIINKRINVFINDVKKMMNKVFEIIAIQEGYKTYPTINFELISINKNDEISEELLSLYDKGLVSRETLFENSQYSYEEEREKREKSKASGDDDIFTPPLQAYNMSKEDGGRPVKELEDRKTSPDSTNNDAPSPSDEKDS